MEIIVRDLAPSVVKELNEEATKLGLSRQNYLKNKLENHVMVKHINEREMEIKNTLDKNTEILYMVGDQLKRSTDIWTILLEDNE